MRSCASWFLAPHLPSFNLIPKDHGRRPPAALPGPGAGAVGTEVTGQGEAGRVERGRRPLPLGCVRVQMGAPQPSQAQGERLGGDRPPGVDAELGDEGLQDPDAVQEQDRGDEEALPLGVGGSRLLVAVLRPHG